MIRCMNVTYVSDNFLVSVGGTTGLFVGASLLSFVELFFFFTVRFISNILMERKKTENVVVVEPRDTPVLQELPELEEIVSRNHVTEEAYVTSGVPTYNTINKPK